VKAKFFLSTKFFKYALVPGFFLFAAIFGLASCSVGKDEGSISIALPSRAAFAGSETSAARAAAGDYISVFIFGDYQAEKTVPFVDMASESTVTFDSIPSGAVVRVVCSWFNTTPSQVGPRFAKACGAIGVSDEITVEGGAEQLAAVVMREVQVTNSSPGAKIFYKNAGSDSCISLPGDFSYEFSIEGGGGSSVISSSSAELTSGSYSYCIVTGTILYGGTEVLSLYVAANGS